MVKGRCGVAAQRALQARRITEISGHDLSDVDTKLNLHLAVRLGTPPHTTPLSSPTAPCAGYPFDRLGTGTCDHRRDRRLRARPRRPRAQPPQRRRRHPARRAGRVHRGLRLGQVVAGLRHALRRGAAPLLRVGGAVRAPAARSRSARRTSQEITGLPPAVALQQRRGRAELALVGRHHHHAVQPAADALLARRRPTPPGADQLDAEAFSPNTAAGACPRCHGLGVVHDVTEELLVPDPSLSIREGAIAAWPGAWQGANLRSIVTGLGIDVDRPWRRLPKKDRDWLLFTDEQPSVLIEPEARPRSTTATTGSSGAPASTSCTSSPTPRASGCASGRCASSRSAPCPDVPRQRAAAGGAGGDLRRALDRRGQRAAARRAGRRCCRRRSPPTVAPTGEPTRSRCGSAPTWSPASRCCSTWAWATSASGAARRPCRPARRSGCGSPPSCARGCSASSTCSTSPRPACTRPTRSRCSRCSTA